jgi:hypothetical protein
MAKFDVKDKQDIAGLSQAVGESWKTGDVFRENRLELMRQAVGFNYSDHGAEDEVPMNLLELAMNIYLQRLVAQNPQVSINTFYPQLKEIVTRFELAGNNLIEDMNLGDTLSTVVYAALLSKGIVKIALNKSSIEVGGITHASGRPFVDAVSLDNWIEDMTVSTNEDGQFEGNYWYPTIDEAMELFPDLDEKDFELRTDENGRPLKDHDIQEGDQKNRSEAEFRPIVVMLDLYLKKQNMILQCVFSGDKTDPIGKVANSFIWDGPKNGPYRKLGFGIVEGCTMPSAPAQHWIDVHDLTNNLFRKLGRQATREKTVLGVRQGGDQDGDAMVNAADGETIKLDDPNNVAELHTGGVSQPTLAFVLMLKDIFSYMGGNLDNLGGLGPQSETLGQDQLLSASASMRIQKMQKEVTTFTTEVLKDVMWYLWYDPNPKQKDVIKKAPGFETVTISVPFNPEDREGDFLQYNVTLEPFSMQHQSPETKMQGIRTILAEIVQPLLPMMEAQGVTLDIEGLFQTIGKLSNIPELGNFIKFSSPDLAKPVGTSSEARQAPNTTRTNIRKNIPGATQQGKSAILQQSLLGNKAQKSQVDSLTRASA